MATPTSIIFTVQRSQPELVAPAKPTPHELKQLSDIDDQTELRFLAPVIQFYRYNPIMQGKDPVKVIREAVAHTLVFYYPFAGRLRELGPSKKLAVDCTGEGVVFIEADADVTIEQFGDRILPPIPCMDQLLYNVPGSDGILNCPLLLIQVTRLKCGGFIVASRHNHTISDGTGIVQFMNAVGEMARGSCAPSVLPTWRRELLNARDPPHVTCVHNEYVVNQDSTDDDLKIDGVSIINTMVHRFFFLGPQELSTILKLVSPDFHPCSKFEILTACVWRCYTVAFQADPNEETRMQVIVDARPKFNPPLPKGYYGNAIAMPIAVTTAGKLCKSPLGYAVELLRNAKNMVTEEYMRSVADLMVIKGRPKVVRSYKAVDFSHLPLGEVDFGWGKPAYMGPPSGLVIDGIPAAVSHYFSFENKKGEKGTVMLVSLPMSVMKRFADALEDMLNSYTICPVKPRL